MPGITAVMHTFGCSLNFHPHIHILVSDGGLADNSTTGSASWQKCSYFPEKVLKARFRYLLVKKLRQWVWGKLKAKTISMPCSVQSFWRKKYGIADFFVVTQLLYKVVWYVFIGERLSNAHYTTRYIGRYAKRPCISETNIAYYSYERQLVSFVYKDKITRIKKMETVSVENFIKRLISHIPEKNFRMIRHYGFYANRVKNSLLPELAVFIATIFGRAFVLYDPDAMAHSWRQRIHSSTGSDPLVCPRCRVEMKLIEMVVMTRAGPKTISFVN